MDFIDSEIFIIAEAGVNHNGSIDLAKRLIDAAADSGADAVKFQTFIAEEVVCKNGQKAAYQMTAAEDPESQYDMIKKLELSMENTVELMKYATQKNILFLSTPFDEKSVDLLVGIGVPLIKISSGELTNHPFLRYVARKNLPVILSTGMSTLEEVGEAVTVIKEAGCSDLTLLHCTSNYPALYEECNLRAMKTMTSAFNLPVGYSDHTKGTVVPIAAAAMGACIIEKHFTIDRNLPGPDHKASLTPDELKEMVLGIRIVEKALGSAEKSPVESELEMREIARRSIMARIEIPGGTAITMDMLSFKRPGTGIAPMHAGTLIGKIAARNIHKDEIIKYEYLE